MRASDSLLRLVRNFSALTLGKVAGDFIILILFILVSRRYGQDGVGHYSFAMALTGFISVIAEFGLHNLTIKQLSRHAFGADGPWRRIFPLRLLLSAVALGVLLLVTLFLPLSSEARLVVGIIGLYQIIFVLVGGISAVFVAREEMHVAGLLEVSLRATIAVVGVLTIAAGGSLPLALASYPAAAFAHLVIGYVLLVQRHQRPPVLAAWSDLKQTAREAVPFALSSLLFPVASRFDVVCLGFLLGAAAAGIYNVAYRIIFVLLMVLYYAGMAIFPLASRAHVQSRDEVVGLYHRALRITVLASIPMAGGLWLIAPRLVTMIFGDAFAESAVLLRGLALLLCLGGLKYVLGTFLMATDRQAQRTAAQWVAAGINVVANVVLISMFGVMGAVIAVVLTDFLLVVLLASRMRQAFGWPRIGLRLAGSVIATAAFIAAITLLPPLPLVAVILLAVMLYVAILLLFPAIRRDEIGLFLSLVRRIPTPLRPTAGEVP